MWEGCHFFAWLRLLVRNRFAIDLPYLYIAVIVTFMSLWHTILHYVQEALYGEAIDQTPIRHAPIFIIGHWRTGTTLLHELLVRDPRHNFPTTYECLDPNHFLLTETLFRRWLRFLMPTHRPMDNMRAGWERPQEDEFALCNLGQPSPYLTVAFPNHPPADSEYWDLRGLPRRAVRQWQETLVRFLKAMTYKDPRRLVLKSPTHSCRVRLLLELFPDARFIHIVRDPYVVFPSTVNLWKSLYRAHGLQRPTNGHLEEHVFQTFTRLYKSLEAGRKLIPRGQYHELRYEDLVVDPMGEMENLYEALGLENFETARPRMEAYLASVDGYETNHYQLLPGLRAEIGRRWGDVIRRYGYARPEERAAPPHRPEPVELERLEDRRDPLAAPDTHRRQPQPSTLVAHRVQKRRRDPGPART
jgi:hypothetical protein